MYCICCKKNNVIPFKKGKYRTDKFSYTKESMRGLEEKVEEEDILWKKSKRPDGSLSNVNNEMIDNGIIHIIDAGYGSVHDGDQFVIAICDDCIKENLEDATLLYYGNYMYTKEEFIEKEKEKSKQKYRRRKNLDGLV
jgi:hypothetical protein